MNKKVGILKDDRDVNKKASSRNPKYSLFLKLYLGITVAALIIIAVIWGVLWNFLKAYEASQPELKIETVAEAFEAGNSDELMKYMQYQTSEFEDDNVISQYIKSKTGGEWEYTRKSGAYTKETPVYQLKKDGKPAATVFLKKSSRTESFNTPVWEIDKIEDMLSDSEDYTITVPQNSVVTVNSKTLDASYIIADNVESTNLGNVTKYITTPKMTTYQVSGLVAEPVISAVGPVYSSNLEVESNENNQIIYGFESTDSFKQEQQERIIQITQIYGNYITNDVKFRAISPYILSGSYAYSYLQNVEKTNIWTAAHSANEFADMNVYNYQIYTDKCFSCEVKFNLIIHATSQDFTYPTHIKYVFIKSGNTWYVADISLKKS